MIVRLGAILLTLLFAPLAAAGEPVAAAPSAPAAAPAPAPTADPGFRFALESPAVAIAIPGVPAMALGPHPMGLGKPHLRALGSSGPWTVSVITPTADAGMTAEECARSQAGEIAATAQPPEGSARLYRINEQAFLFFYGKPFAGAVSLNGHVLGAIGGTHCLQVHVSLVSTTPDDIRSFFDAFADTALEAR